MRGRDVTLQLFRETRTHVASYRAKINQYGFVLRLHSGRVCGSLQRISVWIIRRGVRACCSFSHALRKVLLQLQFGPHCRKFAHRIFIRCAVQAYEKLSVGVLVGDERIRCSARSDIGVIFLVEGIFRLQLCLVCFVRIFLCMKRSSTRSWSGKCWRKVLHRFHLHSALLYAMRQA